MSLIIKFNGSFKSILSKFELLNEYFFDKTGINYERLKIMQNTESIKFDTMESVNDTDVVFCVVLEKDFMDLEVELPNKAVMPKVMSKHNTINDIKKLIYEKADMSLKDIKLLYNDKVLNDNDIIWNSFGEEKCPRITVSIEITVQVMCQRSGFKNEIVTVDVWTGDKVCLLKEAIDKQCSFDITSCDRVLTFDEKCLDNYARLMDYGIKDGSMLEANYFDRSGPVGEMIRIYVSCNGMNYSLSVGRGDTVGRIKKLYRNKIGVKSDRLQFNFNKQIMSNERTLKDYGIKNNHCIMAMYETSGGGYRPIDKITVDGPNGQRFTVTINRMIDTIRSIRRRIETEEGYKWNEYDLLVDGRMLKDGTFYESSMEQWRLVEKRRVGVTFDILENEAITGIPWEPNMRISDIKRIITNECGLFVYLQQLSINGVPREDNDTIATIMPGQSREDIIITCGIIFPDGQL